MNPSCQCCWPRSAGHTSPLGRSRASKSQKTPILSVAEKGHDSACIPGDITVHFQLPAATAPHWRAHLLSPSLQGILRSPSPKGG